MDDGHRAYRVYSPATTVSEADGYHPGGGDAHTVHWFSLLPPYAGSASGFVSSLLPSTCRTDLTATVLFGLPFSRLPGKRQATGGGGVTL